MIEAESLKSKGYPNSMIQLFLEKETDLKFIRASSCGTKETYLKPMKWGMRAIKASLWQALHSLKIPTMCGCRAK
jgi:hypothetical protein